MSPKHLLHPRLLAVLLLSLGGSVFAADADVPAASDGTAQVASMATAVEAAPPSADCPYGMCKANRLFIVPSSDSVLGSDVMPNFNSPALNVQVKSESGC